MPAKGGETRWVVSRVHEPKKYAGSGEGDEEGGGDNGGFDKVEAYEHTSRRSQMMQHAAGMENKRTGTKHKAVKSHRPKPTFVRGKGKLLETAAWPARKQ